MILMTRRRRRRGRTRKECTKTTAPMRRQTAMLTVVSMVTAVFGVLAALFALVPLVGTVIVWGPGVLYLASQGDYGHAIFLTLWGTIAVGMVDNFLRPLLISGRAAVPALASIVQNSLPLEAPRTVLPRLQRALLARLRKRQQDAFMRGAIRL